MIFLAIVFLQNSLNCSLVLTRSILTTLDFQSWVIFMSIPPQLRKLRKTLFKRKLHELLLKVLETEEVYVDINAVTRINLMSLLS